MVAKDHGVRHQPIRLQRKIAIQSVKSRIRSLPFGLVPRRARLTALNNVAEMGNEDNVPAR
jgi:hypothetical protein